MMTPAVWISTSSQSAPAGGLWLALITIVMANTATILRKFRDPNIFKNGFIYLCSAVLGLCCCVGFSPVAGDGSRSLAAVLGLLVDTASPHLSVQYLTIICKQVASENNHVALHPQQEGTLAKSWDDTYISPDLPLCTVICLCGSSGSCTVTLNELATGANSLT